MNPAKLGKLGFWTQVTWVSWVLEPSGGVVGRRPKLYNFGETHSEESKKYYFAQLP